MTQRKIGEHTVSSREEGKKYRICSVIGGLDVTRLLSFRAKAIFSEVIQDIELIREFISLDMTNGGVDFLQKYGSAVTGSSMTNLDDLNNSLQWKARGYQKPTTTLEAGFAYVDDRPDRFIDKLVLLPHQPLVGSKQTDLGIVDAAGQILPWIVDRQSGKSSWWMPHQNGQSQGPHKEPRTFKSLYTCAWLGTYGNAWAYYPPINKVLGLELYNMVEVVGPNLKTHDLPFVVKNLPQNNPTKEASFTSPYADSARPGKSMISATAPVYFSGNFGGFTYNDTYVASIGIDITVTAISSLLDIIKSRLTKGSFGLLVDSSFKCIAISQAVVEIIYPKRTGFEKERVIYSDFDGSIISDLRNKTYEVSDTIVQSLVKLKNADWNSLLDFSSHIGRGERDYTTLNITITGHNYPTEFYVMIEKWDYVADWMILTFAPVDEVRYAIAYDIYPITTDSTSKMDDSGLLENHTKIVLSGQKGEILLGEAMIQNVGNLDIAIQPVSIPEWLRFKNISWEQGKVIKASENATVAFDVDTSRLAFGMTTVQLSFNIVDDDYPDCFFNQDDSLSLAIEVNPKDCVGPTGDLLRVADSNGNCVCAINSSEIGTKCVSNMTLVLFGIVIFSIVGLIFVRYYVESNRKKADSVWEVDSSDLLFDDPAEIVGRGTFGLVLLAEYRGTQVAVKRVLPPQIVCRNGAESHSAFLSTFLKRKRQSRKSYKISSERRSLTQQSTKSGDTNDEIETIIRGRNANKLTRKASDSLFDDIDIESFNDNESQKLLENSESNDSPSNGMMSGGYSSFNNGTGGDSLDDSCKRKTHAQLKADFIEEMRYLSKLRHPCITTVMGAVITRGKEPLLIMEYMDYGSCYDLLHNQTMKFEGDVILSILRDIARGMRFLHSSVPTVVHGDLKAANVLVDSKFRAKVADFGLSMKKAVGASGTPYWMAPELLRGECKNSCASDVYSFGMILYEIYSRKDPYYGEDFNTVIENICDRNFNKRPPIPPSMPNEVANLLMNACLAPEPKDRPSFTELDSFLKRFDASNMDPGQADHHVARYHKAIADAKRSANLLNQIFPNHIIESLREGRAIEPEPRDCVTVFFSDICGFTTISSDMSAAKVNDMLNRLFIKFDKLSMKHGIFKIETIGDAWMGVANLVEIQDDHVMRIAQFSIDAMFAAKQTPIDAEAPNKGTIQIRVGFHSGPIVAGVVGKRLPKYTLFGDTVNTASRMESNSLPGRIQCTDRSASLLQEHNCKSIRLKDRGKISIKGKGLMHTYFVWGPGLDLIDE